MNRTARKTAALYVAAVSFGILTLAACADNLNGPSGECLFAYELDPGAITLNVADSVTVRATPVDNCGGPQSVTWRMEDVSKATVRSTGNLTAVVRGVARGTTILNAENGSKSGFTVVEVR